MARTNALSLTHRLRKQHYLAAATSLCLFVAILFDRTPPLDMIRGEIIPDTASPEQTVKVRWTTDWQRQCDGVVSREVVGADRVIRAYAKIPLRVPTSLGIQTSDTLFIVGSSLPEGHTEYRASIQFSSCGITSRIWPITVETPALSFTVKR